MIDFGPKISIVTPVFNAAKFLEDSIKSVINQNYPNLEYIIIDGGSTDGSVDIIKKYSNHINYWESKQDKGQTHALNKGFSHTTGIIQAWLNADEEYLPGALELVANEYMKNKDLELIYGNRYFLDLTVSPPNKILETFPAIDPFPLMLYTGRLLCSDATFWTKKIHEKLGELNEKDYPRLAMDVEWLLRLTGEAKKWKFIPKPLSIFKAHGMNMTTKGVEKGYRYNEIIRRNYAEKNKISSLKLFFGWFWYSTKLRLYEKGLKGLFTFPKWDTISYLFLKSYKNDFAD